MKKIFSLVLALLLISGCSTTNEETVFEATPTPTPVVANEPVDITINALKGPTAMGLVSFMDQVENGEIVDNNYQFEILSSIDEIVTKLTKGEIDIAAVPANLASTIFNSTNGEIQVVALNTLGVLYIIENSNTISSIADLEGKTIYATGKGATPDLALSYLLDAHGLTDKVTIEWKSEAAEVLSAIIADENAVAMLPEPFVTTALSKNENLNVALDLTEEWENTDTDSALVTGVLVARKEFINDNPDAIETFLTHYEDSVNFINEDVEEGAKLVGKYEIVSEDVALVAIPKCNIVYITGEEMQEKLSGYLEVLFNQNPKTIGNALPTDEFYYSN